jgi:hypothetical protein
MKSAGLSTENYQGSHSFCISWRRVGGPDRFRHWVLADSIDDAVSRSHLDVSKALGSNVDLWSIEQPIDKVTNGIPTDVVWQSVGNVRPSHGVRIIASICLVLCSLFLFWTSRRDVSPDHLANEAAPEVIIPVTPLGN